MCACSVGFDFNMGCRSGFPISVQFHLAEPTLPFQMNRKWRKCGCFCYCCVNKLLLFENRPAAYSKLRLPCLALETNAENNAELAFAATWNTKRSQIKFVSCWSAKTASNMEMSQRDPVPPRTRAGRLRSGGDRERGKRQFECAMTDTFEAEPIKRERFAFDVRSTRYAPSKRRDLFMKCIVAHRARCVCG